MIVIAKNPDIVFSTIFLNAVLINYCKQYEVQKIAWLNLSKNIPCCIFNKQTNTFMARLHYVPYGAPFSLHQWFPTIGMRTVGEN